MNHHRLAPGWSGLTPSRLPWLRSRARSQPRLEVKPFHLAAVLAALLASLTATAAEAPKIAAREAARLVAEGTAVLVDCREPKEWTETGVAAPAELLAKSDFDGDRRQWDAFLAKHRGKQILVYCRTGRRSGIIAHALAEKGIPAANAGGLKDWTDAGLPIRAVPAHPKSEGAPQK